MNRWMWFLQQVESARLPVDKQVVKQMEEQKALELIAQQIRELRKSRGLTQAQLARKVGSDQASLSRFEAGKVNAGYAYVSRLLDALNA